MNAMRLRASVSFVAISLAGSALLIGLLPRGPWDHQAAAAEAPSFSREIAPLFQARCLKCHSGPHPKGGFDLTTRDKALAGGDEGETIVPHAAERSLLFIKVHEQLMPPKQPLSAAEVALLQRWIDAGAPWEGPALAAAPEPDRG